MLGEHVTVQIAKPSEWQPVKVKSQRRIALRCFVLQTKSRRLRKCCVRYMNTSLQLNPVSLLDVTFWRS